MFGLQRASVGPDATKNVATGRPVGCESSISCRTCIVAAIASSRAGGGADRHRRYHLPHSSSVYTRRPGNARRTPAPQAADCRISCAATTDGSPPSSTRPLVYTSRILRGSLVKQGYDVVVAGAGNAAFCAALAARERVGRVLMLEKAPRAWIGGNTYFTAGTFRTTFSGVEELSPILDDVAEEQLARTELPPYTEDDFVADMNRVTEDCCDDELTNILASEAADAVRWLHGKSIRWRLMYDRQSFEVGGKRRFWGGWSSERWAEAEGSYNSTSPRPPGAVSKFGASAR